MSVAPPLLFRGTLLNQQGNAIDGAKIQLWQTDLDGNYLHSNPNAATSPKSTEHSSIVSSFQYFGTDATDSDGDFEFLTYRPGIYTQRPFSHFHFMVWLDEPAAGDDGEVTLPSLVTQFYFRDESPPSRWFPEILQLEVTEVDSVIYEYGSYVNATIVIDANPSLMVGNNLLATTPTQPKGPFYPDVDFFSMDNDLTTLDDTTMQSTAALETSTKLPIPGPTPVADTNNDSVSKATSAAPTLQPVKLTTPQTTQPILILETSTQSPTTVPTGLTTGPILPIQSNYNVTQSTSTTPMLQPVQPISPSATSLGCRSYGRMGFWWMAFMLLFKS